VTVAEVRSPLAADGVVVNDSATRTLVVRPAKAGSYAGLLWRQGCRKLLQAEQNGRYGPRIVWAHGLGRREIARGQPVDDGSLRFRFERGDSAYRELVSTPGLAAVVTVDRETAQIMGVRFRGRCRPSWHEGGVLERNAAMAA
jgi:hypothetical protein